MGLQRQVPAPTVDRTSPARLIPMPPFSPQIEDIFVKYGRIRQVDLKTPARPPAFAFIEFDDSRDASDAVRGRDGYDFYGHRLRVELAKGSARGAVDRTSRSSRDFRPRQTGFRVRVKGLPMSASWQDLKDHFRRVVTPSYTNVIRERGQAIGVVEFDTLEDMERAIRWEGGGGVSEGWLAHVDEAIALRMPAAHV